MPPRRLPNAQDNKVVEQLARAPSGGLKLDHFASDLRPGKWKSQEAAVVELRLGVIQVHVAAAKFRASAKVPKDKIRSAEAALASMRKALDCSEAAKLDRFWLEFSAVIPRLGGAESDESLEIFGRPEGVYSQAGC
jgi:hypothetical protein